MNRRLYEAVGAFVAELAAAGVREVVLAPGSRSTPLALAFARHDAFRVRVALDERSAAFFALGQGKAGVPPAVVLTTSGTAAANLLPAAVEAYAAGVPLILLTADRPRTLRDTGAAQTIDQVRLFGVYAKWFADLPDPAEDAETIRHFRRAAVRAVSEAVAYPPGPVHLNVPMAEPLVPPPNWRPPEPSRSAFLRVEPPRAHPGDVRAAAELLAAGDVLVVAGEGAPESARALAEALGAPLLADPLSPLRRAETALTAYEAYLRAPEVVAALRPRAVLRVGRPPTSKALLGALAAWEAAGTAIVQAGTGRPFWDPLQQGGVLVAGEPAAAVAALAAARPPSPPGELYRRWEAVDRAARRALDSFLRAEPWPFEGGLVPLLAELVPPGTPVMVGNSMPVRDADLFLPPGANLRLYANRGANGIDGVVSTAAGLAARLGPTVLVVGDLSFHHDQNGLQIVQAERLPLLVLLVNNDGGGIFSFLPQAELPEFERLFGTPHGLDFAGTAATYGLPLHRPHDAVAFRRAVREAFGRGPAVVEVRTRREDNRVRRESALQAAEAAARAALATAGVDRA